SRPTRRRILQNGPVPPRVECPTLPRAPQRRGGRVRPGRRWRQLPGPHRQPPAQHPVTVEFLSGCATNQYFSWISTPSLERDVAPPPPGPVTRPSRPCNPAGRHGASVESILSDSRRAPFRPLPPHLTAIPTGDARFPARDASAAAPCPARSDDLC